LGMQEDEVKALSHEELKARNDQVSAKLFQAGAHYVIDGIWDLPEILEKINNRLAHGERP
jgi:phosphonoacetaldehyde hydrolase